MTFGRASSFCEETTVQYRGEIAVCGSVNWRKAMEETGSDEDKNTKQNNWSSDAKLELGKNVLVKDKGYFIVGEEETSTPEICQSVKKEITFLRKVRNSSDVFKRIRFLNNFPDPPVFLLVNPFRRCWQMPDCFRHCTNDPGTNISDLYSNGWHTSSDG